MFCCLVNDVKSTLCNGIGNLVGIFLFLEHPGHVLLNFLVKVLNHLVKVLVNTILEGLDYILSGITDILFLVLNPGNYTIYRLLSGIEVGFESDTGFHLLCKCLCSISNTLDTLFFEHLDCSNDTLEWSSHKIDDCIAHSGNSVNEF